MSASEPAGGRASGQGREPTEGDIVERPCAACGAPVRLWWSSSVGDYPVYHGGCFAPAPA